MTRIKFERGQQRIFLKKVLENVNCPSLRAFGQFGFDIPYSTLKNYFSEKRSIPQKLFSELCGFAKINQNDFDFREVGENWGQVLGGKRILNKIDRD